MSDPLYDSRNPNHGRIGGLRPSSTDIVERLRETPLPSLGRISRDRRDAANEIEHLRLEHQHACQEIGVAIAERDEARAVAQEAGNCGEPVAWLYDLATAKTNSGKYALFQRRISWEKPESPEGSIQNLRPLYAAPQPLDPAYAWQDISTAPKRVGKHLRMFGSGSNIHECEFIGVWHDYSGVGGWVEVYSQRRVEPTHWMEIGPSPSVSSTQDGGAA